MQAQFLELKGAREIRPEQAAIANRGTCFDLGTFCTFTGTLTCSIFKTPYQAILRPDMENKPDMVSTGQTPLEKLQSSFTRDTKMVFLE
jgi:hypothetical protein